MNGQVDVDRGRMEWKLVGRPNVEHAAKVWSGGRSAWKMLESAQMRVGR